MLLTGDIEKEAEQMLVSSGKNLRAQVLKVPHHGSRRSSTEAFLDAVRPTAALVSVGYRNPFRHPNPEVLERYRSFGTRVWRTDQSGAITVEMRPDGTRVCAITWMLALRTSDFALRISSSASSFQDHTTSFAFGE